MKRELVGLNYQYNARQDNSDGGSRKCAMGPFTNDVSIEGEGNGQILIKGRKVA